MNDNIVIAISFAIALPISIGWVYLTRILPYREEMRAAAAEVKRWRLEAAAQERRAIHELTEAGREKL